MKKLLLQLALPSVFFLTAFFVANFGFAQPTIPNLQGTWEASFSGKDTDWYGQQEWLGGKSILFIYQKPYEPNTPNLTIIPQDDPEDPFQGFVQGSVFSFYKNNQHGEPNLGREIIIGKVNTGGNSLSGLGIGFDSNTDWGSAWYYKFGAKKISDSVP